MEKSFWHKRWENNEIAFHDSKPNIFLKKNVNKLLPCNSNRIFLPLCGKTLDISWLLSKGYSVAGSELSKEAIEQLFIELKIKPSIKKLGNIHCYSAKNIDIFVGDFFELSGGVLGSIDGIYDRASLVALPQVTRQKYSSQLSKITNYAPQLLITYEYNQNLMDGPPFSITNEEVKTHYNGCYKISLLEKVAVEGGLKGKCPAFESAWLLT